MRRRVLRSAGRIISTYRRSRNVVSTSIDLTDDCYDDDNTNERARRMLHSSGLNVGEEEEGPNSILINWGTNNDYGCSIAVACGPNKTYYYCYVPAAAIGRYYAARKTLRRIATVHLL